MTIVPLTVEEGFSLHVIVTGDVHLKENELVRAKVIDPVYSFDREVIPAGAELTGRITGFDKTTKWKRLSKMLGGDFTPIREPQITFTCLSITGRGPIAIETIVVPASDTLLRIGDGKKQPSKSLKSTLMATMPASGKAEFGKLLWGLAPYHPQSLANQSLLKVVLKGQLHFGTAVFEPQALAGIGSPLPPKSIVAARLITSLDSSTARPGEPVEALLTRPLFSPDDQLLYPVGSKLHGEVLEVRAARKRHRNAELAFRFTSIEPPASLILPLQSAQDIDAHLKSVRAVTETRDLHINEAGEAWIKESKTRFVAPAMAFVTAFRAINASEKTFGEAVLGSYRSKFIKQITGGRGSGLGLAGSISGAIVPPVGLGLGFYGLGRSLYKQFLARGQDIRFRTDTMLEIELQ